MNPLPRLRRSTQNPHLLTTEGSDDIPFFLLGDTAWELFHRLTPAESEHYFQTRAAQGFNLICAVALAELDGLHTPNAAGHRPLDGDNPRTPNAAYFAGMDAQIAQAAASGLYIGLLPTWGDKVTAPWGAGPRVFHADDPEMAREYGQWLGARYKDAANLLWILGGDRPAKLSGIDASWGDPWKAGFTKDTDWIPLWRAMAAGIQAGTGGKALISYHPQGGPLSTSQLIHTEPWLDLNMMQSGHSERNAPVWDWIARDLALLPLKPTLDAEPNYEDHPVNPWPDLKPELGSFRSYDVRKQCYRSVFSGGCGVVYGHHAVWQFWDGVRENVNHADRHWPDALLRPGAVQAGYLRRLLQSRPGVSLPTEALLASNTDDRAGHECALRDENGRFALVYAPLPGQTIDVVLDMLAGPRVRAAWFDPRLGEEASIIGEYDASGTKTFTTPSANPDAAPDWVLTLDCF